jgi:glutathione S-transferase
MILVGQYDSPFVRRVAVTLHHYHMPFERNTLSVFSNAKKMQKINPLIRIPSLELAPAKSSSTRGPSLTTSTNWRDRRGR